MHDDLTTLVKAAVIDEMDDAKVLKQKTKEGEHSEDYYVFEERIS